MFASATRPRPRHRRRGLLLGPAAGRTLAIAAVGCVGGLLAALAGPATASVSGPAPGTVRYFSSASAPSPPGAHLLVPGAQASPHTVSNAIGQGTGWWELTSGGSTVAPAGAAEKPAPSGSGYVVDGSSGARVVSPGDWRPTVTLRSKSTTSVVVVLRVFTRDAQGSYVGVVTSESAVVKLTNRWKALRLPLVSSPSVALSAGQDLYVDLLVHVVAAGSGGNAVTHQVDAAGTQLTLPPVAEPGSSASPTATPTASPSPSASASPSVSPAPDPTPTASAAGGVWHPGPGTTWQWQITGSVDTSLPVQMYDIDLFDAQAQASTYDVPGFGTVAVPRGDNAGVIDQLHASGKVVICYLDTGAWESYRPDAALFPSAVRGNSTGWSGERWLDIRRSSWPLFEPLMSARLDLARRSGCDGVEADQNNPIGNSPGFAISLADQKAWYLEVARLAHERSLSVGQKNGIETTDADTVAAFDWNLNEECRLYSECQVLRQFVAAGKAVFHVEYVEEGMTTASFCPQDEVDRFDGLLKGLDLTAWRQACA
jgi:hypothetical protein